MTTERYGRIELGQSPSPRYLRASELAAGMPGHMRRGAGRQQLDAVPVNEETLALPAFAEFVETIQSWKTARFIDEGGQFIPGALSRIAVVVNCFHVRERGGHGELHCWRWPHGWQRVGCRILDAMLPWSFAHVQDSGAGAAAVVTPLVRTAFLSLCPAFDSGRIEAELDAQLSGPESGAASRPRWLTALLRDLPMLDDLDGLDGSDHVDGGHRG